MFVGYEIIITDFFFFVIDPKRVKVTARSNIWDRFSTVALLLFEDLLADYRILPVDFHLFVFNFFFQDVFNGRSVNYITLYCDFLKIYKL